MGKDCVDLHCLKTQIKGDANESVAQIKPLGWIYIYILVNSMGQTQTNNQNQSTINNNGGNDQHH